MFRRRCNVTNILLVVLALWGTILTVILLRRDSVVLNSLADINRVERNEDVRFVKQAPGILPNQNMWWKNAEIAVPPALPPGDAVNKNPKLRFGNAEKLQQQQQQPKDPRHEMVAVAAAPLENKVNEVSYDPNGPGEMNVPIIINKDTLPHEERLKYDEGWRRNAFNQYASDMMSVHRRLPDMRDADCLLQKFHPNLPPTTVILCFHNEAWSIILRSVHSIIDRSPPHLIHEIVLVDDFSSFDHLKDPLKEYMDKLGNGKIKIVRAKKREGLIRARMMGAAVATGEVLTFLDSHIETTTGWLEPLLDHIAKNWTNVAVPVIDAISDETLHFSASKASELQVGGFDWNLQYDWHMVPEHEKLRRGSVVAPTRTPTMAGGLFSISKRFFDFLGQYDPGFDIWGGENLEISFKIWMCGGEMHVIPCSHVGHIFRKRSPYSWGTGNVLRKNTVRLAEVWMDEYRLYYYMSINYNLGDYGDISDRVALRKRLQCKSFDWYVKTIFPELFLPKDAIAHGDVRNKAGPYCVDASASMKEVGKAVILYPCHHAGGNQFWLFSKFGEIRRDKICVDYPGSTDIITYSCHGSKGNQEWEFRQDGTIFHKVSNKCMEASPDFKKLQMAVCSGIDRQHWIWTWGPPTLPSKINFNSHNH